MARKKFHLNKKDEHEHLSITDSDRGEIYCGGCGTVLVDKIPDRQHDVHASTDGDFGKESRVGPGISLTMYDKGLYTEMGSNKDSTGKRITGRQGSTYSRLRIWDKRTKSESLTRNLGTAFTQLHALKTKLAIPDNVLEKTAYLYRKAISKKLLRGRSIQPFALASLYVACRETNTPRSLDEIAKEGNIRRTTLSRAVRQMIRALDLKLEQYDHTAFITKISNMLTLKEKTKRDAIEIFHESKKYGIVTGKNPVAVAAASIYISCLVNQEEITQTNLSEISGISAVTIRNVYFQIKKKLMHLKIPQVKC